MSTRRPPLTPYPLPVLMGRIVREWETRHRILDLPSGRFFAPDPAHDLSVEVAGQRVATPAGPAAGPHTQLAENFVLGWLAGARTFELKTVQILDELDIDRPCIDMETVGYNVEWSQELSLDQSLEEYVKAWMVLEMLRDWEPLHPHLGRVGHHVFDMSVGYDLAGISSPRMATFIEALREAGAVIDELRQQIPEPFAAYRDHPFPTRLIRSATLSTFHGCPPEEIEGIVRHLIAEHDLDVTVKLNPTLLGYERTRYLLHDRLGYEELRLIPDAFEEDLSFDRAVDMIPRLAAFAHERGRGFGIKLSNTLVVENHRQVLPGDRMYLSGPPLHVLAVSILDDLVQRLPGVFRLGTADEGVAVSFAAGIDKGNFADAVGLGLAPVTLCSDLLKPGGYGRLSTMLKKLSASMHAAGCTDIVAWCTHQHLEGVEAGHRDATARYAAFLVGDVGGRPYGRESTAKLPRALPKTLQMWDCVSCNLCVTVCPNDAMLHLATPEELRPELTEKWQYLCLAELCNDCGNCTTFCPEQGAPFAVKPRLFFSPERFLMEEGQAFLVTPRPDDQLAVVGSPPAQPERERLLAVLGGPEGLPVRPGDLAASS